VRYRAHRFAWFLTYGKLPEKDLLHECDTPLCVNPKHLSEGTQAENIADCVRKNRNAKGESSARAKLKAADVVEIRELLKAGLNQSAIAERFNVTQTNICAIKRGKSWRSIEN
jgi:predicted XRE-type DNA-binding protein